MATLAELLVRLGVDDAQFTTRMRAASKTTKRFGDDLRATTAKIAGIGAATVTAAAGLALIVNRQAEAIAGYQDLSDKIGDTAENITRLKTAADISGTALETVSAASVRLTATLSKQDEESKGAAQAIQALGLNFGNFKTQAPVEQLGTLADAFAQFEDDANKTAVAVALFGKAGAEVLPFLNDLAEDTERSIKLTQTQIARVDEYTKSLARLQSQSSTLAQQYAADLVPVLDDVIRVFANVSKEVLGTRDAAGTLRGSSEIQQWAKDSATAVAVVAEVLVGLTKLLGAVVGSFRAAGADIVVFGQTLQTSFYLGLNENENAQLGALLEERNRTLADANDRWSDLWNYNGTALSDSLRKQFSTLKAGAAQQRSLIDTLTNVQGLIGGGGAAPALGIPFRDGPLSGGAGGRPSLNTSGLVSGGSGASAAAKSITEAERYIQSLRDQNAALAFGEAAAARYQARLLTGVTPAQREQIEALLSTQQALTETAAIDSYLQALNQQVDLLGKSASEAELYKFALMDGVTPAQIAQVEALLKTVDAQQQLNRTLADQEALAQRARGFARQLADVGAGPAARRRSAGINQVEEDAAQQRAQLEQARLNGLPAGADYEGELARIEKFRQDGIAQFTAFYDEIEARSANFNLGFSDALQTYADSLRNVGGALGADLVSAFDAATASASRLAAETILWGDGGAEAAKALARDLITQTVAAFIQAGAQAAAFYALQQAGIVATTATSAAAQASTVATATASNTAIAASAAPAAALTSLASFGSNAIPAAIGIALVSGAIGALLGGAFEDGGSPPLGKLSLVGEGGPELFVPKTAGTILPADVTSLLLNGRELMVPSGAGTRYAPGEGMQVRFETYNTQSDTIRLRNEQATGPDGELIIRTVVEAMDDNASPISRSFSRKAGTRAQGRIG